MPDSGLYARMGFTALGVDYAPNAAIPLGAIPDEDLDILKRRKFVAERPVPTVSPEAFAALEARITALEAKLLGPNIPRKGN